MQKIDWLKNNVHIWSAVKEENRKEIEAMTDELCKEYIAKSDTLANKMICLHFSVLDTVSML